MVMGFPVRYLGLSECSESKQKQPMKYTLHDTFNRTLISRHRTMEGAVKSDITHARAVKRANGKNSFITTEIRCDGKRLDENQQEAALGIQWAIETGKMKA